MDNNESNLIIKTRGLTKSFKDVKVLNGLDLAVPRGTVLALLGPNGAGKTTTIRILSTLLPLDDGEATVNGYNVVTQGDQVRSSIGLTGQYAAIDEYLTGAENLKMMGRLYRLSGTESERRTKQLLQQFDLVAAGGRAVKTYSGGMRRRLDLAVSLIASPPVVFLDEPTTGLDPRSRLTMWSIIEKLVASGTTILLTTQHLEEADRLADRIAVLDDGRVIAEGTANQLKQQVGNDRLELTISKDSKYESAVQALGGRGLHPDAEARTIQMSTSDGMQDLKAVLDTMEHAHIKVDNVSLHRPTLDDVFLTLTGHQATEESKKDEVGERSLGEQDFTAVSPIMISSKPTKSFGWAVRDSGVLIARSLKHIIKNLDQLLSVAISPLMFLLLFRYVFGGAINTGGTSYVNFLVAGILVQMAAFGASTTAVSVAADLKRGIVDRFRSLPMFSPALLIGHVTADLARNIISSIIMLGAGFLVGFRPNADLGEWLLVLALLLVFTFSVSWLSAIMGLLAKSVEAVQWLTFLFIFPLTFASSAFVPTEGMSAGLRAFAENQPVTHVIEAMRAWLVGTPVENHATLAFVWFIGLAVIAIPIAAVMFRRRSVAAGV